MKFSAIQLVFTFLFSSLYAQTFEADTLAIANFPLSKVNFSEWGDFDNDNDFDLLISWVDTNQTAQINILSNVGNSQFFPSNISLTPVINGDVEFFDFDKDNDLDILLAGTGQDSVSTIKLYRNENETFLENESVFPELTSPQVTSLDYNNDGYPDILLTGLLQNAPVSILLKNEGSGSFTEIKSSLPGLMFAETASVDLNNDSLSDIIICGKDSLNFAQTQIFINNSGVSFSQLNTQLTGFYNALLSAADYDNDGDFDILISGQVDDTTKTTSIVRNDGNDIFSKFNANLPSQAFTKVKWGDFDNNGFSDIFLFTPDNPDTNFSKLYFNNGDQTFTDTNFLKNDTSLSEFTFADIDADASLDFLTLNTDTNNVLIARIFKNSTTNFNTIPQSPTDLSTAFNATSMTFKWQESEDAQTPSAGLTYNIRIGTTPGGSEIISALARSNGFGKSISSGNIGKTTSLTLPIEQLNSYPNIYWSVQTIDPSYTRSFFSDEQSFVFDFTENQAISSPIAGINAGSSDWGDFDNDGDLDLLLTGQDAANGRIAKIYRNDGDNLLTEIDVELIGIASSSAIWFDYNNDNLLDIVISGASAGNSDEAEIYKNNGDGTFSAINSGIKGAFLSELDWGDFDNDGDADLIQTGFSLSQNAFTAVYRNNDGQFTEEDFNIPNISGGISQWCDFDNDGLLDIFLSGMSPEMGNISKIYKNISNGFIEITTDFPPTSASAAAIADYDNDGDSDILLTGLTSTERISKLFINQGNMNFAESSAQFEGVSHGSAAFGDYDNDGDFDIILSGFDDELLRISKIYSNEGDNTFSELITFIQGVIFGTTDWVDIDNDNDLDIFITGSSNTERVAKLYQNNSQQPNTKPVQPDVPVASLVQNGLSLAWPPTQDAETPQKALTYNLRIGSTPGGSEIMSALASTATGIRRILNTGNVGYNSSFTLLFEDILDFPSVYWSLQAVDNSFSGSSFSEESSLNPLITSISDVPNDQGERVTIEWRASSLDHNVNVLTSYSVWRSLPNSPLKTGKNTRTTTINQNVFAWEWLATLPAHRRPTYSYTSETLYDSTSISNGEHFFIIAAHTNDSNIFFDSLPESGFSIDNIAPEAPQNLTASFDGLNIVLTWSKNNETDLKNYVLYQSKQPGIIIENMSPFKDNIADTLFTTQYNDTVDELYFVVAAQDSSDNISLASNEVSFTITGIEHKTGITPNHYSLYQNYPNPFNPDTKINYDLPKDSFVKIQVFNIRGETIRTLVNDKKSAGNHSALFNAQGLPSGTYFYRIVAGEFIEIRKMILLR